MMKSGNYNRIKEVLEEQGRTQTWLAKKLNITFRQVNSYCSNASQPSIPVLYDISILLQTPASELLRESSEELLKTDDL